MADRVLKVVDSQVRVSVSGAALLTPLVAQASAAVDAAEAAQAGAETAVAQLAGDMGSLLKEESGAPKYPLIAREVAYVEGAVYRHWAIVAPAGRRRINFFATPLGLNATFDLVSLSASGTGAAITARGNGEVLIEATVTAPPSPYSNFQFRIFSDTEGVPHTGDNTLGVAVLGVGIEKDGDGLNLLTFADDFTNGVWNKNDLTVEVAARRFGNLDDRIATPPEASAQALAGMKWAALGTSITEGDPAALHSLNHYAGLLESRSGMVLTNLGKGGASLGQSSNGHSGSLVIYNQIALIPVDTELVTIEAGINDFALAAVPLGAVGDTATATFSGALYAAVETIRVRAPNARIVFKTPFSGGLLPSPGTAKHRIGYVNANGNRLEQFQKTVDDVAGYTGFPVIDVGRQAGIGYFTSEGLTVDGLHLNPKGASVYADFVLRELLNLHARGYLSSVTT